MININAPRIIIWLNKTLLKNATHRNKINNMLEGSSDIYIHVNTKSNLTISPKCKCYITCNILTNIERITNLIRDFVSAKQYGP